MKKEKYKLEDIDFRIVKYFDAYIKQTLKYTKIDFIKQISDKRNHDDLLKEWKHKGGETADSQNDRYIFGEVRLDNYIIGFESEILFKQIMHLTEKQREVLLKNVVLDIPMEKIAQQMKIQENKVYKHKKNALSALAKRIKPDEI